MEEIDLPPVEFLQRAYTRLRKSYWEPTMEEALEHPVRGKILRGLARELQRRGDQPPEENPPKLKGSSSLPDTLKPMPLDQKRLASGERDGD